MADEQKPVAVAAKKKLIKGRHHSAIKRHRQNVKRAAQNRTTLSTLRSSIKKVRQAVTQKDAASSKTALKEAVSLLHRAGSKGIIHRKNASRNIAKLSSLVSGLAA